MILCSAYDTSLQVKHHSISLTTIAEIDVDILINILLPEDPHHLLLLIFSLHAIHRLVFIGLNFIEFCHSWLSWQWWLVLKCIIDLIGRTNIYILWQFTRMCFFLLLFWLQTECFDFLLENTEVVFTIFAYAFNEKVFGVLFCDDSWEFIEFPIGISWLLQYVKLFGLKISFFIQPEQCVEEFNPWWVQQLR